MKIVKLQNYEISNNLPFTLIAGPCQLEGLSHSQMIAGHLKEICDKLNINLIFKGSFDKANRSALSGKRGIGMDESLKIFESIKKEFGLPVLTDVHETYQCDLIKNIIDVIQIPAFLCRQTDLLLEAGKTGKIINIKKGQFLAPAQMQNAADKILSVGNDKILLTERGTSFGYGQLIVDPTALITMAQTGFPTIIDATHSVQQPGGKGSCSGGNRDMVEVIARCSLSSGLCGGVFLETHQDPDNAPSDGPNCIDLKNMEELLTRLKEIDEVTKRNPIKI